MLSYKRSDRVADLIQRELSELLRREVKDPRIGFVTVMRVALSSDLRHAKVYVSVLGEAGEKEKALRGLESGRGFLRGLLGRRLRLKVVPELKFQLDESISYSTRINRLLADLKRES